MGHGKIRVGAQLHPQQGDYAALRDAAGLSEELGFDIVYNWDHFYPLYGDRDGQHFECFTVLGAWAEQTSTIEIGPLVACNSYRNPNLLVDMARTIDHISGGRFVLGVGSGWFERDYDEYGYEFGTAASRLRHLRDNLPIMEARLEKLNPQPVRPIPILIAGTGPQFTLPMVARHADRWHARFPQKPSDLEPAVAKLQAECAAIGRDPNEIIWGLGVDPNDLDRFLDEDGPALVEMGFEEFTLGFNGPDWDVSAATRWLAWRDELNAG
ncbi:MAG: LLM class F420-dependent oxidoreductase [Acidimicrobiia bacterium]|nr:LLM class F420-dependent oxidoreductase [Acidimicrobiia bacterium]